MYKYKYYAIFTFLSAREHKTNIISIKLLIIDTLIFCKLRRRKKRSAGGGLENFALGKCSEKLDFLMNF